MMIEKANRDHFKSNVENRAAWIQSSADGDLRLVGYAGAAVKVIERSGDVAILQVASGKEFARDDIKAHRYARFIVGRIVSEVYPSGDSGEKFYPVASFEFGTKRSGDAKRAAIETAANLSKEG